MLKRSLYLVLWQLKSPREHEQWDGREEKRLTRDSLWFSLRQLLKQKQKQKQQQKNPQLTILCLKSAIQDLPLRYWASLKVCQIILNVEKWIWRKGLPRDMVRLFGKVGNLISVCMVCFGAPGAPGGAVGRVAPPRPRDSSKSSLACASRVTAWVVWLVFWDDICSWWTKKEAGVWKSDSKDLV